MITQQPIRFAISTIHLAIAIFCSSIVFMVLLTDGLDVMYGKKGFMSFLALIGLSVTSLIAGVVWLTQHTKIAQRVSYGVVLSLILLIVTFVPNLNKADSITFSSLLLTVSGFIFLLAYSKINPVQVIQEITEDTFLDADFLISEHQEQEKLSNFWKPNRIVSCSSFIFTISLFILFSSMGAPLWATFLPCAFFIGSVVLWRTPKTGSWIFSIVSILSGLGGVGLVIFGLATKHPLSLDNEMKFAVFVSVLALSVLMLCFGMAMFLLSKEAQQEWK